MHALATREFDASAKAAASDREREFHATLRLRFGEHLVRRGVVAEEVLIQALERGRSSWEPLGRIALELGQLSMSRVFQILDAQLDSSKRFGELAIELGFLKGEEVDGLLAAPSQP